MRLVAGITGQARGVFRRSHLRKSFGFRSVCFVAAGAEYGCIEFVWLHGPRVIRMHGQRPVARFAIHMRMLAIFLLVQHVCMAGFAGLMPGEFNGADSNFGNRVPAIVPVLSEAFRDYRVPDDQKQEYANEEDPRQSKEMSRVFEDVHSMLSASPCGGRSAI